jgi:hypothetical protein
MNLAGDRLASVTNPSYTAAYAYAADGLRLRACPEPALFIPSGAEGSLPKGALACHLRRRGSGATTAGGGCQMKSSHPDQKRSYAANGRVASTGVATKPLSAAASPCAPASEGRLSCLHLHQPMPARREVH